MDLDHHSYTVYLRSPSLEADRVGPLQGALTGSLAKACTITYMDLGVSPLVAQREYLTMAIPNTPCQTTLRV